MDFNERKAVDMKERFAKLLDVKSIVTLALTAVFCAMEIMGTASQEFMTVYTVVIAFYFGTQAIKKAEGQ